MPVRGGIDAIWRAFQAVLPRVSSSANEDDAQIEPPKDDVFRKK
jgi:hypothetical protein